ncbi:MAG: beta-galactosidase [Clostridia bacterium]|nr:beta-galactosidase [Clostridia bacterium]
MAKLMLSAFGHGGDYNPDQWLDYPEVLEQDVELMKKAHVNLVSVAIFAWSALEPEEGRYETAWLRKIIDRLYENGISVLLATPSGARPAWMSVKYPEVLRVDKDIRNHHGNRHNHCFSSPVYRQKVHSMNEMLAREFGAHPAVKGWHISNEYSGECRCEYCQQAFRQWLKKRYGTLEEINKRWWTAFWSKTFTDWDQIRSPEANGEMSLTPLKLAWRRFVSDQTLDFIKNEIEPIRRICPDKPVTINTMGFHYHFDYASFADVIDFFGYDSYPYWGSGDDVKTGLDTAFTYDFVRGFGPQNWSLMESVPSQVNWHDTCKLKRPGMHMLSSLQAVAHGSDTVMMFQWRKGRGGPEKFHGAVISHDSSGDTRVFRDVTAVGEALEKLKPALGSKVKSDVALIFDQQNRWALDVAEGPQKDKQYMQTLFEHYRGLKRLGINVDVVRSEADLSAYKLVAAPYLYMLLPGVADKLKDFVSAGGTLVLSYMSGLVDEDDLCFMGGFPGPLKELAGIINTETDALYPYDENGITLDNPPEGMKAGYKSGFMCALINPTTARTVGTYSSDFYKGTPALTVNKYGKGECWYLATRPEQSFLEDFYGMLAGRTNIQRISAALPEGVTVSRRENENTAFTFYMNFTGKPQKVAASGRDMLTGDEISGEYELPVNGILVTEAALGEIC